MIILSPYILLPSQYPSLRVSWRPSAYPPAALLGARQPRDIRRLSARRGTGDSSRLCPPGRPEPGAVPHDDSCARRDPPCTRTRASSVCRTSLPQVGRFPIRRSVARFGSPSDAAAVELRRRARTAPPSPLASAVRTVVFPGLPAGHPRAGFFSRPWSSAAPARGSESSHSRISARRQPIDCCGPSLSGRGNVPSR